MQTATLFSHETIDLDGERLNTGNTQRCTLRIPFVRVPVDVPRQGHHPVLHLDADLR